MGKRVAPLESQAVERLAQTIGDHFTGTEITTLFSRAGYSSITHDGGTKWRFVAGAFEELQKRDASGNGVLQVIKTAANPQGWIGRRDAFESLLAGLNAVLAFYALKVLDDGRLVSIGVQATTVTRSKSADELEFDARGFHEAIRRHGRSHFCRGAYFHAVFECCKALDSTIRKATGSAKSGQALMAESLGNNGSVKLNALRTQSERDEQQGIMYLCMGLMNAVRNPQAHEPELHWPMSREDALDVLAVTSFLFRKLHAGVVASGTGFARIDI